MHALSEKVIKGDRIAISKAITLVENRGESYREFVKDIFTHTGNALVIGVTGPPGAGKSSLVDRLVQKLTLERKKKVAILAVDPSSPFSGGAILGDRVRMLDLSLEPNAYIRSMASRGDPGGLSKATLNAVRVLDASGFDYVIVETVGIGQAEFEILEVADIIIVVLMPETGDEIQAFKAGILEIGHIFAVNKSDLPGADKVIYNLDSVLTTKQGWRQKALKISAKTGEGVDQLVTELDRLQGLMKSGKNRPLLRDEKEQKIEQELLENVSGIFLEDLKEKMVSDDQFKKMIRLVFERKMDPETATEHLVKLYASRGFARKG